MFGAVGGGTANWRETGRAMKDMLHVVEDGDVFRVEWCSVLVSERGTRLGEGASLDPSRDGPGSDDWEHEVASVAVADGAERDNVGFFWWAGDEACEALWRAESALERERAKLGLQREMW